MSTFLALLPTGGALGDLRELERPAPDGVRWEPERRWHVTVCYTSFADDATQSTLREVADEVAGLLAPPTVVLGPATERLGRDGTLVIPASGVDSVARAVDESLDGYLGARHEPFYGHLTIARLRRSIELPATVVGMAIRTTFTARSLYLIESNAGPDGSVYDVLHQVAFTGTVA
jgi:2'-5' RNA ligase